LVGAGGVACQFREETDGPPGRGRPRLERLPASSSATLCASSAVDLTSPFAWHAGLYAAISSLQTERRCAAVENGIGITAAISSPRARFFRQPGDYRPTACIIAELAEI
jgi:hypothetical protein